MGGLTVRHVVPLSISLPSLRQAHALTETQISRALRHLHDLFCPFPAELDLKTHTDRPKLAPDSGYASEDDVGSADDVETPCLDPFERDYAVRWLSQFIGRADELSLDGDTCERFVDVACSVLSYLTRRGDEEETQDDDPGMTRKFEFSVMDKEGTKVSVELHDTPMQTGEDHTDVGLQTWGASIALSDKICRSPQDFGLGRSTLDSETRIVELGAGTGLVSLVLSSLLPHVTDSLPSIVATDYHPTVLLNLESNIASHRSEQSHAAPVRAAYLDWCAPTRDPPFHLPADIIVAADVAYAPEHSAWLRDCAAHLLAPDGVFWLMVSVRPNGKFAGISDTVETAFVDKEIPSVAGDDGRSFKILDVQWMDKNEGVGRADEIGYKLFKIGWA